MGFKDLLQTIISVAPNIIGAKRGIQVPQIGPATPPFVPQPRTPGIPGGGTPPFVPQPSYRGIQGAQDMAWRYDRDGQQPNLNLFDGTSNRAATATEKFFGNFNKLSGNGTEDQMPSDYVLPAHRQDFRVNLSPDEMRRRESLRTEISRVAPNPSVPESPQTVAIQAQSMQNPQSPRKGLLITPGEQLPAGFDPSKYIINQLPGGRTLYTDPAQTMLRTPEEVQGFVDQGGLAELIGKVESNEQTGAGPTVLTTQGGVEANASRVSTPEAAQAQIAMDQQAYPGSESTVTDAQSVAQQRQMGLLNPVMPSAAETRMAGEQAAQDQYLAGVQQQGVIGRQQAEQQAAEQRVQAGELPQFDQPFDYQGRQVVRRGDGYYDVATGQRDQEAELAFAPLESADQRLQQQAASTYQIGETFAVDGVPYEVTSQGVVNRNTGEVDPILTANPPKRGADRMPVFEAAQGPVVVRPGGQPTAAVPPAKSAAGTAAGEVAPKTTTTTEAVKPKSRLEATRAKRDEILNRLETGYTKTPKIDPKTGQPEIGPDGKPVYEYGKDYDKTRNWKDFVRGAALAFLKGLQDSKGDWKAALISGLAGGGMSLWDPNFDNKLRDQFQLQKAEADYQREVASEQVEVGRQTREAELFKKKQDAIKSVFEAQKADLERLGLWQIVQKKESITQDEADKINAAMGWTGTVNEITPADWGTYVEATYGGNVVMRRQRGPVSAKPIPVTGVNAKGEVVPVTKPMEKPVTISINGKPQTVTMAEALKQIRAENADRTRRDIAAARAAKGSTAKTPQEKEIETVDKEIAKLEEELFTKSKIGDNNYEKVLAQHESARTAYNNRWNALQAFKEKSREDQEAEMDPNTDPQAWIDQEEAALLVEFPKVEALRKQVEGLQELGQRLIAQINELKKKRDGIAAGKVQ